MRGQTTIADDFRIGLFYPTTRSIHNLSTLNKTLNRDPRPVQTHIDVIRAVEDAGLDFVFLADGWGSRGPATTTHELGDPMMMGPILASALIAASQHVKVINTMHMAWLHPLQIARIGANLDALSSGRWGMNAVSGPGFNPALLQSVTTATGHDEAYARAAESMEIIRQAWSGDGEIDFQGDYFQAKGRMVGPIPNTPPVVVSAGASPAGCAFAGRYASFMYIPGESPAQLIRDRRETICSAANAAGRNGDEIKVILNLTVVLGETQAEADELSTRLRDTMDPDAFLEMVGTVSDMSTTYNSVLQQIESQKDLPFEDRPVCQVPIVDWTSGDPVGIADKFQEVYDRGLCDGLALSFIRWQPEQIRLFGERVVPILTERGLWTRGDSRGWPW